MCARRPQPPTHLRLRREHSTYWIRDRAESGSPPLARGAPALVAGDVVHFRLTSARAESTAAQGASRPAYAAHLRSRGEHPRTLAGTDPQRLTSARAESAPRTAASSTRGPAHLHLHGERWPGVCSPTPAPPTRRAPGAMAAAGAGDNEDLHGGDQVAVGAPGCAGYQPSEPPPATWRERPIPTAHPATRGHRGCGRAAGH